MRTVRVAAGVIVRRAEVLICQRLADGRHPLRWEFPGGKLEAGEAPADCTRRELREELDIEAETAGELWRTRQAYGEIEIDLTLVAVPRFRGQPRNLCFADIRWVAAAELASYDFLEADREFIALSLALGRPTAP